MFELEKEYSIIRAVLAGDIQQYSLIVKEYQQIVANLTFKLTGNRLDVEEVTQQVFVELYTSLPRFRFESRLSTFIYRITVNTVSKMLSRENRIVSIDSVIMENKTEDHSQEVNMLKEEQSRRLHQAIGQLKNEQRTALVLYTFDNFSYQDIAEVMQVSLSKVESLIFRAKKNLKKIIEANSKK